MLCFQSMKSPDWSHVANPSRCQFCRSEYHLSSDELYPEPASLQLAALTQIPPSDRPRYRGHGEVVIGSSSQLHRETDAIYWWGDGDDTWWTESAGVQSQMSASDGNEFTSADHESGSQSAASSADDSLELSDLVPTRPQVNGCSIVVIYVYKCFFSIKTRFNEFLIFLTSNVI